jgi:hypothetical protein
VEYFFAGGGKVTRIATSSRHQHHDTHPPPLRHQHRLQSESRSQHQHRDMIPPPPAPAPATSTSWATCATQTPPCVCGGFRAAPRAKLHTHARRCFYTAPRLSKRRGGCAVHPSADAGVPTHAARPTPSTRVPQACQSACAGGRADFAPLAAVALLIPGPHGLRTVPSTAKLGAATKRRCQAPLPSSTTRQWDALPADC